MNNEAKITLMGPVLPQANPSHTPSGVPVASV